MMGAGVVGLTYSVDFAVFPPKAVAAYPASDKIRIISGVIFEEMGLDAASLKIRSTHMVVRSDARASMNEGRFGTTTVFRGTCDDPLSELIPEPYQGPCVKKASVCVQGQTGPNSGAFHRAIVALPGERFPQRSNGRRGRPLETALQGEVSNHHQRLRSKALVVSLTEKAQLDCVRYVLKELNVIERLRTCRKHRDVIKTGGVIVNPGQIWRQPAYWPDGDRHEGGRN